MLAREVGTNLHRIQPRHCERIRDDEFLFDLGDGGIWAGGLGFGRDPSILRRCMEGPGERKNG